MHKAVWNGEILAESRQIKNVNGKHFFPLKSIKKKYFKKSYTHRVDLNIGKADFYNIHVNDKTIWNAAWYYPHPQKPAEDLKGYLAFAGDIDVIKS